MGRMDADPEGMVALEHLHQRGGDPLRKDGRRLCADPDELHVRDLPQTHEQPFDLFVGQGQRIAAGEEDVPHFRMRRDVLDALFPLRGIQAVVAVVSDHPRTGAVAAVGRAGPRHEKQDAVRIAMDDSGNRAVLILMERVVRFAAAAEVFVNGGHNRPAQGLLRVPWIEETRVVRGDRKRERARRAAHRVALILRKTDHPA